MNITVWGINFAPELTGIGPYNVALCEHLSANGHSLRMVTAFPYYPSWKKQPGDKGAIYRTERIGNVTVHRCWQYVPRRPSGLTRILHELSFVVASFFRQLFLPRSDLMVVISPPLLLGAAAWLLTLFKPAPFCFHVQDLQPDAALGLGMLKRGWLSRCLYALEAFAYRKADRVSGISEGMLDAFARKGVPRLKTVYFPNGVNIPEPETIPVAGTFRERHGLAKDAFLAAYSGNLGVKQGLDVLIEAAQRMRNRNVRILISGDGARREALFRLVKDHGLENVIMLPLQPEEQYREMLVDIDLAVITQETGTGQFFFPSKLLRTLAFGKPVLTVADEASELSGALGKGQFGVNVAPNQPDLVAAAIETLSKQTDLQKFGEAGQSFVQQFEFNKVLTDFEIILRRIRPQTLRQYSPPSLWIIERSDLQTQS
ncbi:MAG TPA: WcaI family glycosyltransferase [Verrucomicrobiae bacterium]|jgi:colanic acid biosynthesis glycosyl transferase WcaI